MTKIAVWNKEQGSHVRDMTAEEETEFEARQTTWNSKSAERKLAQIKDMRKVRLEATDYLEPIFSGSDGVAINIHSGNYTSFSVIKIG